MEERRYWIDTGIGESDGELPPQYKLIEKEINEKFSPEMNNYGNLVVKGFMTKEEAEAIRKEIVAIHEKYGGCAELISMSIQPQCPKCGQLFRFSDTFCARCGVELILVSRDLPQ